MLVNAAMPCVGSRFCDDVHHGSGIASVFRTELVGHENILLDKLGIGNEEARTSHAVVVIILTVNLLVIVAAAQAVDSESRTAVRVGKPVVACCRNSDRRPGPPTLLSLLF